MRVVLVAMASVAVLVVARASEGSMLAPRPSASADATTSTLGPGPGNPAFPEVVADGSSGFDAVWADDTAVMTAHWSAATRSWSDATPLSGRLPGQTIPELAGSASGAAAAAWRTVSPLGPESIQASYRSATAGAWQPAVTLFSSHTKSVSIPRVGIDGQGDGFVLWETVGGVHLVEYPVGGSAWSRPSIVPTDGLGVVGFAVSPAGTLVLDLERHLSGGLSPNSPSRNLLYVKVRPAGSASWLPPRHLGAEDEYGLQGDGPPGTYFPGPRMAINASGTVFVTWQWLHRNNFYARAAILPAARGWWPRIVTLPVAGLNPAIAGDDRGFATVLWDAPQKQSGPAYITQAEVSPRGRVLGVRKLGTGNESVIAADGTGDVVAAWIGYGAQLRPAGQKWCPRLRRGTAQEVAVAVAPDGVAQLVWHYGSNTSPNAPMMATTLTRCRA